MSDSMPAVAERSIRHRARKHLYDVDTLLNKKPPVA